MKLDFPTPEMKHEGGLDQKRTMNSMLRFRKSKNVCTCIALEIDINTKCKSLLNIINLF